VMLSPIVCGVVFGTRCVTGLLAGAIVSGVQMAISSSNTGGAWDNAKKYISKGSMDAIIAKEEPETVSKNGKVNTKKSQIFKEAVTGDTVGDPLKDTSGPALNILMKLMAILSVVFAPLFLSVNGGGGYIAYLVPKPDALVATTTLLALGGADGAAAAAHQQPSSFFAAIVFSAGMAVGMGGLFITQRVRIPTVAAMQRESLHKPLLVAKAEAGYQEGTDMAGVRASTYAGA